MTSGFLSDLQMEEIRRLAGWLVEYGLYFDAWVDLMSQDSCLPVIASMLEIDMRQQRIPYNFEEAPNTTSDSL